MEWWTHLWLNEGFASFMENYCTNALFPEYNIWTQFVTDTLIPAFQVKKIKTIR
jgi:puromycin-sensitive aminopeptidase